jgi:ribosomal protein S18 acetylase RimI-like enzyme
MHINKKMDTRLSTILNLNPRKNIASVGYFNSYPVVDYYTEKKSTLILGKSDEVWAHLISSDESELSELLHKHHKKTKYYHSVEDWMIPRILKHGSADWILTTDRYILDDSIACDSPTLPTVKIEGSLASYIHENSDYKSFTTVKYIEERLMNDISVGIIVDNQLLAWGLTHDDGSLGFLHVLNEYRNRGYGKDILLELIHQRRRERKSVFGNIEPGNRVSCKLASKLGFRFDQKSSWIKLK